jgi:excisionase family DNA binding protein
MAMAQQLSLELDPTTKASPVGKRLPVRRMTVVPNEAAALLGVSRDFFDEYVKPELRIIRRGRKTILIPVAELERWVDQSAARWND